MPEKEPCFWTCNDCDERLDHEDEDEAILYHLDGFLTPKMTAAEVLAALPETIEVYGYARDDGPSEQERKAWASGLVEQLLEWIDDEWGDPNGATDNENEPACKDIALEMVNKALEGYIVWQCSKVCTKTVNVKAWIEENEPDWLKD